jgi:Arc/MetJ-type ribon-helix-helix transcriptional regulator
MVSNTMITVTKETRQILKALVVKRGFRSYEELIRSLVKEDERLGR